MTYASPYTSSSNLAIGKETHYYCFLPLPLPSPPPPFPKSLFPQKPFVPAPKALATLEADAATTAGTASSQ
jgi:hypothetical protein